MTYEWLAGFFDGEGCIHIGKHLVKKPNRQVVHSLDVNIGQKFLPIIKEISEKIMIGRIKRHITKFGKPYYALNYRNDEAKKFLERVEPFLVVKKMQAKFAIQFQKGKKHLNPLSAKEIKWREMHYLLLRKLKEKGR